MACRTGDVDAVADDNGPFFGRGDFLERGVDGTLVRGGERVALLGGGQRPATGRYGMETLTRCLAAAAAAGEAEAPLPPLPRHARLLLLSDFLLPPERLARARRELIELDLIAFDPPLYQVLSLPETVPVAVRFERLRAALEGRS